MACASSGGASRSAYSNPWLTTAPSSRRSTASAISSPLLRPGKTPPYASTRVPRRLFQRSAMKVSGAKSSCIGRRPPSEPGTTAALRLPRTSGCCVLLNGWKASGTGSSTRSPTLSCIAPLPVLLPAASGSVLVSFASRLRGADFRRAAAEDLGKLHMQWHHLLPFSGLRLAGPLIVLGRAKLGHQPKNGGRLV